ncbi:fumarylacetoacetate (FAA) hydrolase family protein [Saccharothrix sp. NRRL B-16348]|jgi:hypothetical protein|uniref:fumarylacetoacetate (FAA) hydrolase n=1 Tax=Saccharothrix sp. NRRL B-16348 TaxID=1415542 RepID=UPI0006AEC14F|nr:fumarylacetoacetate (FAA) hydrolase [Saccharothrix sp. NRRL B-16348]KOX21789.1 fumarylacetoacetate (FAA) hydrolase family protein [Saccharothrix sp. NRRL B-16348]
MSILFECEYKGERYVGFGKPAPGDAVRLYRVADGQLHTAITESDGGLAASVVDGAEEVTVTTDDPELRYLPPLLPTATGNAMVSGFMRTHRSKFDDGPDPDAVFIPPNWFFKGFGSWLRMPAEPLAVPASPIALIEEPEIVLVYVNGADGTPHYAGYTFGNDLCDIGLHRENPGWNPYCKLCDTSIAPWLFLDEPPRTATGRVTIERAGATAWEGPFACGADDLYFRVEDMVDHLFSYPAVRRPGMVNYVLLGADKASFHDGFRIADGDRVTIDVTSHDVVLSNVIEFGGRAGAV